MTSAARLPTESPREVFGHPRGLWVLAGTEMWDRVSYHGMRAILTLYLASTLLKPGWADSVIGFSTYRRLLETMTGPLSADALAAQTFGFYVALVFGTPLLGGIIGDRWLTRRTAVVGGALMMTAGHFSLAFDASFLFGLLLLAFGAGLLRPNLSPQIRDLYPVGDRRESDAFQIYYLAIDAGAFIAPLATGTLALFYGWHVGFGFAGFGMLIGLMVYLLGARYLPIEPVRDPDGKRALTDAQRRRVGLLLALWPLLVCFWIAQSQVWNVYNLWVRDHVDLHLGQFIVPIPWLQSLDALLPAATIPGVIWWSRRRALRGQEPGLMAKMGWGSLIFAAGVLILAIGSWPPLFPGRAGFGIVIAFHMVSNLGAVLFAASSVNMMAARSPAPARGLMVGINGLSVTAASLISGRMGGYYEQVTATRFWLVNAMIVGAAGAMFLLLARRVEPRLAAEVPDQEARLDPALA